MSQDVRIGTFHLQKGREGYKERIQSRQRTGVERGVPEPPDGLPLSQVTLGGVDFPKQSQPQGSAPSGGKRSPEVLPESFFFQIRSFFEKDLF
jgi:hypothetical protein